MNIRISLFAVGIMAVQSHAWSAVSLPAIFSDHMVLQKGKNTPLWGQADPGEKVAVTFKGKKFGAIADNYGKWRVHLDLLDSGSEPFEISIEAGNRILISDVVVGEVWLAAGQSNMALGLEKTAEAATEIPASADPLLRMFSVNYKPGSRPVADYQGRWVAAHPSTSGRFSAVAYYFAKMQRKEIGLPVGMINSSMSSTPIESWMSGEALDADPSLKAVKDSHWSMRETGPVEGKKMPIPTQTAAALFEGMIQPLIPYGIRGFLWSQGESNATLGWQYRTALRLLINDWREKWGVGDLPFYFCQAANFGPRKTEPGESDWSELRESQAAALQLPNTGMAVTIDTEEGGDLHPRNKKAPGERLARLALAHVYGKKIAYSGPVLRSFTIEGDKVRISFDHVESGLISRVPEAAGGDAPALDGFVICGENHKWVWAKARIEGNDVVVWSDDVPKPLAVRYAWADNPKATLFNSAGLPAAPFRTDDFPAISRNRKNYRLR